LRMRGESPTLAKP